MRTKRRSWVTWLAVAAAVLLFGFIVGVPADEGRPLDPHSAAESGTLGLVEVLRELGASVAVEPSVGPATDTALVLEDRLGDAVRADLLAWVEAGGTLVVTDPRSPLIGVRPVAVLAFDLVGPLSLAAGCDLAAVADLERVSSPVWYGFPVPDGGLGCFRVEDGRALVVIPHGDGRIVAWGAPAALVNAHLGTADNALLAVGLLAPRPGTRVTVLPLALPGEGVEELFDLVPARVRLAVAQLLLGFLLIAWWRGRRLGPPVEESQLVAVPASELVVAVGNLMQRARQRDPAARILRDDLRRDLALRFGLPPTASAEETARSVAARSRVSEEMLRTALVPAPLDDDEEFVALAQLAERVRREVGAAS